MFIFCSLLLTLADNLTIYFLFEHALAYEFCYENKRFLNQIPRNNRVTHGNRRTWWKTTLTKHIPGTLTDTGIYCYCKHGASLVPVTKSNRGQLVILGDSSAHKTYETRGGIRFIGTSHSRLHGRVTQNEDAIRIENTDDTSKSRDCVKIFGSRKKMNLTFSPVLCGVFFLSFYLFFCLLLLKKGIISACESLTNNFSTNPQIVNEIRRFLTKSADF
jgi:hypothetical protein